MKPFASRKLQAIIENIMLESDKKKHPIGSLEFNTSGTNPADYFGFGTWVQWGSGRVPVGVNTEEAEFATVEKTGGSKTIKLSTDNMPAHHHIGHHYFQGQEGWTEFLDKSSGSTAITKQIDTNPDKYTDMVPGQTYFSFYRDTQINKTIPHVIKIPTAPTSDTGSGKEVNIQNQYITCFMWKRTG